MRGVLLRGVLRGASKGRSSEMISSRSFPAKFRPSREGGNPAFVLLDIPPSAIEQRITKEKDHSSFMVSFFPHAAAN